ncbi:hypothetical protein ON010_g11848 [Phytophthora cinnamomi]|nr:hypothetical protein ON010_g11848 [Phytophthora cinnamomi]
MTDKVKPEAAADAAVILISDDEHDKPKNSTRPRRAASSALASVLSDSDSDSDSDVKLEEILSSVSSATKSDAPNKLAKANKAKTPPRPARSKKARSRSIADYFSTPEKTPDKAVKRRATSGPFSTPPTNQSGGLKPITPSSTLQSSMNASLVFDMVTSLSTNDPGVAIATLRSIVVLGKEYPSDLLYAELIDRIQSHEAIAYNDAVAIYAALVFVFDKAASCSCDLTFPSQWEPLGTALQESDGASASSSAKARAKSRAKSNKLRNNNLIFQAIGWSLQLWKRVYDENGKPKKKSANTDEDGDAKLFLQQEGEQASSQRPAANAGGSCGTDPAHTDQVLSNTPISCLEDTVGDHHDRVVQQVSEQGNRVVRMQRSWPCAARYEPRMAWGAPPAAAAAPAAAPAAMTANNALFLIRKLHFAALAASHRHP